MTNDRHSWFDIDDVLNVYKYTTLYLIYKTTDNNPINFDSSFMNDKDEYIQKDSYTQKRIGNEFYIIFSENLHLHTFTNCIDKDRLTYISFPDTLKNIKYKTLSDSKKLKTIIINSDYINFEKWSCNNLNLDTIIFNCKSMAGEMLAFDDSHADNIYIKDVNFFFTSQFEYGANPLMLIRKDCNYIDKDKTNIFIGDELLEDIIITTPSYINEIKAYTFCGVVPINIKITPNVKTIKTDAFVLVTIMALEFTEGLETIEENSFQYVRFDFKYSNYDALLLPSTLKNISTEAFNTTESFDGKISHAVIPLDVKDFTDYVNYPYAESLKNTYKYLYKDGNMLYTTLKIPRGITYIKPYAFANVKNHFDEIIIPKSLDREKVDFRKVFYNFGWDDKILTDEEILKLKTKGRLKLHKK